MNDIFADGTTEGDKLSYMRTLSAKLEESVTLQEQAAHDGKQQLRDSPDLLDEIGNAAMASSDAHEALSVQLLASKAVRMALRDLLIDMDGLYEKLRDRWTSSRGGA